MTSSDYLNETAELIVRGTVSRVESEFRNSTIWSRAEVLVDSVKKGSFVSRVVVEYEGGTVGDIGLRVSNETRLTVGERVLLYLTRGGGETFKVVGGAAGKKTLDSVGNVLVLAAGSGFSYSGLHWGTSVVSYSVYPAGGPTGALSAVQTGFSVWNSAGAAFSFTYSGQSANTVSWGPVDGPGGTVAVTYIWYQSNIVSKCNTVFDTAENWGTDGSLYKFDVTNVAAHESGHFLVLDDLYDSQNSEMTMYGYVTQGETKKRTLGLGDIAGIQFIYPLSPTTTTSTVTVTSTQTSPLYSSGTTTTTATSYTSTTTSTSTILTVTTVALVPLTATSTVRSTEFLTSVLTTKITSYTATSTSTSTILFPTTVVLIPSTVTSTVQSSQYLTSILTTTVTSYTATTIVTSTKVVYTTVTLTGAGSGSSSGLPYLGLLSLLGVAAGHRATTGKSWRIPRSRSRTLERRCPSN